MEILRNLGIKTSEVVSLWKDYSNMATLLAEEAHERRYNILDEFAANAICNKMLSGTVETAIGIGLVGSSRFINNRPLKALSLIIGAASLCQSAQDHIDWYRALKILDTK